MAGEPSSCTRRLEGKGVAVCWLPSGDGLLALDKDGSLTLHRLPGLEEEWRVRLPLYTDAYGSPLACSRRLVVACDLLEPFSILAYDLEAYRVEELYGHDDCVNTVSITSDSRYVASGSIDGVVKVYDLESGRVVLEVEAGMHDVCEVAFRPGGRVLAVAALKGIALVDIEEARTLWVVEEAKEHLAWALDAELIAAHAGLTGEELATIDPGDGRILGRLLLGGELVQAVAMVGKPLDYLIAVGTNEGRVLVTRCHYSWIPEPIAAFKPSEEPISSIAFQS